MKQDRRKPDRENQYGKALAVFLVIILICTVVSRAADSMTIPKVTVEKAGSGRITFNMKGNGTVEVLEKNTYLVPEGCLVEECLESGTSVKEGDVLIQFQMEYLNKKKGELEQALQEARLSLEQAKLNQQEDAWIPAAEEAGLSLKSAQEEYNKAVAERNQAQLELNQAMAERDQAKTEYDQAVAARDQAQTELDQVMTETGQTTWEAEQQDSGVEMKRQALEETEQQASGAEMKRQALEEAEQQASGAQQALEAAKQQVSGAEQTLSQAQQACQSAEKSDAVTRQNNAKARKSAELGVESAQLSADAAEQKVQEVQELLDQDGKICASEAGIFLNTSVTAGNVTSGSEFVSIGTGGLLFTTEISTSAREKLALGDEISVKLPGREKCKAVITELVTEKRAEDGVEVLLLKALLPEEGEPAVGQASFSLEKKSDRKYGAVLPLTAIRQDNKGYYCLGIRSQSTIMGEEQRAEAIRLTILDQDETKAAVEGAISDDTRIIISSEKQVQANDRVKVEG